jgi:hypothetical protein
VDVKAAKERKAAFALFLALFSSTTGCVPSAALLLESSVSVNWRGGPFIALPASNAVVVGLLFALICLQP